MKLLLAITLKMLIEKSFLLSPTYVGNIQESIVIVNKFGSKFWKNIRFKVS